MTEKNEDLGAEGNWDFDQVVVHSGVQKARAVVSVAFSREDFELVAKAANDKGMKTSAFIRDAALAKAGALPEGTTMAWAGSSLHGIVMVTNSSVLGTSTDSKPSVTQDV